MHSLVWNTALDVLRNGSPAATANLPGSDTSMRGRVFFVLDVIGVDAEDLRHERLSRISFEGHRALSWYDLARPLGGNELVTLWYTVNRSERGAVGQGSGSCQKLDDGEFHDEQKGFATFRFLEMMILRSV